MKTLKRVVCFGVFIIFWLELKILYKIEYTVNFGKRKNFYITVSKGKVTIKAPLNAKLKDIEMSDADVPNEEALKKQKLKNK